MPHYLLTGAGFSRSWGGWLASEAFEYLLSCSEMTPTIREALWRTKDFGFERALQDLRILAEKGHTKDLEVFESMLLGMFNSMNNAFKQTALEPPSGGFFGEAQTTYVAHFLSQFDAIFTLNQDCFLELQYMSKKIHPSATHRFSSVYLPGVEPMTSNGTPYEPPGLYKQGRKEHPLHEFKQPYFKLHGSSNFRESETSPMLIMGGDKGADIRKHYLLRYYWGHFETMVCKPDTRLMVIGYSFSDLHVNEVITRAADRGAKLFIVDRLGIDVLKPENQSHAAYGLQERLADSLVGASRRDLLSTFSVDTVDARSSTSSCRTDGSAPLGPVIILAHEPVNQAVEKDAKLTHRHPPSAYTRTACETSLRSATRGSDCLSPAPHPCSRVRPRTIQPKYPSPDCRAERSFHPANSRMPAPHATEA